MIPGWLPEAALTYLAHTSGGQPLRAIARAKGCHASTVLRQVRRVEAWRDDPLVDEALERIGQAHAQFLTVPAGAAAASPAEAADPADPAPETRPESRTLPQEASPMSHSAARKPQGAVSEQTIDREARRILRRLCEKGAFLAVAPDMEKAVVLREVVPGRQNRIAVVERDVAHAFALQEWIACERAGKISCYVITAVGRATLKRLLTEERLARGPKEVGFADAQTPFQEQHRFFAERTVMADDGTGERKVRFNLAESPLSVLGRKRDRDGSAYLTAELIEAGERLREDFELAQMGPRVTQNWDRFLTAGQTRASGPGRGMADGPHDARTRVAKAMEVLGPGLSDIVFRICCFLEGLETAEKRLGWSARSGKVVLKIALERLAAHYGLSAMQQRRAG